MKKLPYYSLIIIIKSANVIADTHFILEFVQFLTEKNNPEKLVELLI